MLTTQYYRIAEILGIKIIEEIEDIDDEAFDVAGESLSKTFTYHRWSKNEGNVKNMRQP